MTFKEAYTSLLNLYKRLMFPEPQVTKSGIYVAGKWTMSQIDEMDVHFFDELMSTETTEQEEGVYLSDVWG